MRPTFSHGAEHPLFMAVRAVDCTRVAAHAVFPRRRRASKTPRRSGRSAPRHCQYDRRPLDRVAREHRRDASHHSVCGC